MSGQLHLAAADPTWAARYAEEHTVLQAALGDRVLAIEHVGSTSVAGLAAKPVLDIAVVVRSWVDALGCISPLVEVGYECLGEFGIPGRCFFRKRTANPLPGQLYGGVARSHHIHMFDPAHPQYLRQIGFRDHLRAHPEAVQAYEALKRELMARHPDDVYAYAEAKSAFILDIVAKLRR